MCEPVKPQPPVTITGLSETGLVAIMETYVLKILGK